MKKLLLNIGFSKKIVLNCPCCNEKFQLGLLIIDKHLKNDFDRNKIKELK